ncbi:MAG: heavy metal-binding domain-containing protein, partial [Terriglobales bacterium]
MSVDPARAAGSRLRAGVRYYFCSAGCLRKFEGSVPAPATAPAAGTYTCPMHPEVRQAGPGACPICGMALEPL